jgi:phosphohistidine phosphatase SixA
MSRVHVRPTAKTRKRRRRRRLSTLLAYAVVVFVLAWYFESQGTTTVIFVRHADVDDPMAMEVDTPINARGRARAELLGDRIAIIDVTGTVNAIYVDETARTQQTAAVLEERFGIESAIADHSQIEAFMKTVLYEHKREIVLVVTQREYIAPHVEELHGHKEIAEIAANDFDEFILVTIPWWGRVKTIQLQDFLGWPSPVY